MSLGEAVLAVLMALPAHKTDRDERREDREIRMVPVATAITLAAKGSAETAAALLAAGEAETHYARYVGEGRCSSGPVGSQCDPDRYGRARARGYWQLWEGTCAAAWALPVGSLESLRAEASCAAKLLTAGRVRCARAGDPWIGAFAAGTGKALCVGPLGERRAARWRGVVYPMLRKALAKGGGAR